MRAQLFLAVVAATWPTLAAADVTAPPATADIGSENIDLTYATYLDKAGCTRVVGFFVRALDCEPSTP